MIIIFETWHDIIGFDCVIGQFSCLINYSRWEEEYTMRMDLEEKVAELEEVRPNQFSYLNELN